MKPSALQLKSYFFEEVSVIAASQQEGEFELNASLRAEPEFLCHAEKDNIWQVFLAVETCSETSHPVAYSVRLKVRGFFELPDNLPVKDRDSLITNTAVSILYGACRELALVIMGRGPYDPVLLPTVLFTPGRLSQNGEVDTVSEDSHSPPRKRRKGKN